MESKNNNIDSSKPPLITKKEEITEETLEDVFNNLDTPPNASAVELARLWKEQIQQKLMEENGVIFTHKTLPLVQMLIDAKVRELLNKTFVKIETKEQDMKTMISNYSHCFNQWVDCSSHVNFHTINQSLLGNLTAKEVWILTFFAMCTSQRSKSDNLLMLGLVGCSTSGKSSLFESILLEGAHVTTNESGVGRFTVGAKPVLLFHDIAIRTMVSGKDVEKIKAIARTEPAVAKVHSTTIQLPPIFLFYSSNERLLSHEFNNASPEAFLRWRTYGSQATEVGKKRVPQEHLLAIQNRFIEVFVREKPPLDTNYLPKYGGFQRIHGVLGMFPRLISILQKYESDDFHSPYLYLYVLKAMCRYASQYAEHMGDQNIKMTLTHLVFKLVSEDLYDSIIQDL